MNFGTGFAIFFIIWWVMLFVVLPFGHRSQGDEGEVTLGTVESAPANFRLWAVVIRTTIVSAIVFGGYYALTVLGGFTIQDITGLFPTFE